MTQALDALVSNLVAKVEAATNERRSPATSQHIARVMTLVQRLDSDELDRLLIGLETGALP